MLASKRSLLVLLALAPVALGQTVTEPTLAVEFVTEPNPPSSGDPMPIGTSASGAYFSAEVVGGTRTVLFSDGTPSGTTVLWPAEGPVLFEEEQGTATLPNGRVVFAGHVGPFASPVDLFAVGPGAGVPQPLPLEDTTDSEPAGLVVWNGEVWFHADTPSRGRELWRSDGTPAGTVPGPELVPGTGDGLREQSQVVVAGDRLFFVDGTFPYRLWSLDPVSLTPTAAPLPADWESVGDLSSIDDLCLFELFTDSLGSEPWVTDGTSQPTLLGDLNSGSSSSSADFLAEAGGVRFFSARSDGQGSELWTTDGTPAGTGQVLEINPGFTSGAGREGSVAFGVGIVFWANWPGFGVEPTFSDGTAAGTYRIADVFPGSVGSYPGNERWLEAFEGRVVFHAKSADPASEIWSTDGTEAGTQRVADFSNGIQTLGATLLGRTPEGVLVRGFDPGFGLEPWISDGTPSGTGLLLDVHAGDLNAGGAPFRMARVRDLLFTVADSGDQGREPFVTDGTPGGTISLGDWAAGVSSSDPQPLGTVNDRLLAAWSDFSGSLEVRSTDGTPAGTAVLFTVAGGFGSSFAVLPTPAVQGRVVLNVTEFLDGIPFGATVSSGWISDGTASGSFALPAPFDLSDSQSAFLTATVGDRFLFQGNLVPGTGPEPFATDLTQGGTTFLGDLEPGPEGSFALGVATMPGGAFFLATTTVAGRELWFTDGTAAGTLQVADIAPGPASSIVAIENLAVLGESLFFIADDGASGPQVWRSDGTVTGTTAVTSFDPATVSSGPGSLRAAGDLVYFSLRDSATDLYEVWRTDGTPPGTVRVQAGLSFEVVRFGIPAGSGREFVYAAETPATGRELWWSNGEPDAAVLLSDGVPGPPSSDPDELVRVGDRLFFSADDGINGEELHAISVAAVGAWVAEPYGDGCTSSLQVEGAVVLGGAATVELEGPSLAPGLLLWSPEPAWLELVPGCSAYLSTATVLGPLSADASGSAVLPLAIPTTPGLAGAELFLQAASFVAGGSVLGLLEASNGVELILGT